VTVRTRTATPIFCQRLPVPFVFERSLQYILQYDKWLLLKPFPAPHEVKQLHSRKNVFYTCTLDNATEVSNYAMTCQLSGNDSK